MPQIPIFALSSLGENVSELGSSFTYRFKTPLRIPAGVDCTLSLNQASLWFVQPNISAALGNNMMVFSLLNIKVGLAVTLVFEYGLYSLPALQAALKTKLYNLNRPADCVSGLTGNEVSLTADNAQQKLYFTFMPTESTGHIMVHFQAPNFTMRNFLGFNDNRDFTADYDGLGIAHNIIGTEIAKFNRDLSYFIMNFSLSDGSYDSSGNYNDTQIAQMFPVFISPGSQLVHIPYNPVKCQTSIAGQTISSCQFSVTNQSGVLQDMKGEQFSALIVL